MARDQKLNVEITADDKASAKITDVAKKVEALDSTEASVELDVNDQASQKVRELHQRLTALSTEDHVAVLKARADSLEKTVADSLKKLATVDDKDFEATVRAKDLASAELREVRSTLDRLDAQEATVKVDADTSRAKLKLSDIDGDLGALGSKIEMLGTTGGALGAMAALLVLSADATADAAINAQNLASLTGDSVEQASRLNALWQTTGADTKDLQDVLLQMNGVLATNADLAAELGINLNDGASVGDRFLQVSAALDQIPDAAKRSQIASQAFGEEGVRQYNALRNSVDDISTALEEVPSGMVFTDAEARNLREYKKQLTGIKTELTSISGEVGKNTVPALSDLLGALNDLSGWLKENTGESLGEFLAAGPAAVYSDVTKGIRGDLIPAVQDYVTELGKAAAVDLSPPKTAAQQIADEIALAASNVKRFGDDGVENMGKVEEAADDVTDSVGEIRDELAGLRADIANDQSAIDLAEQFDQFRTSAVDAYTATAEGAADAEQKQRDYQSEINATKQAVIDYATEVLGLPAERVTQFVAMIDQGKADQVEALLNSIARNRFALITPGTGGPARFADGTYNAPGGMSVINDGNGPEIVTLPGGSKVMTHANSQNYLNQMGGDAAPIVVNNKTINLNQYITMAEADPAYVMYEAGRRARYME